VQVPFITANMEQCIDSGPVLHRTERGIAMCKIHEPCEGFDFY
jgi:hypothetical protein